MTALHMGSLHAIEVVLVVVLAVGPFLALAAAVVIARRRDHADLASPGPSGPAGPLDEKQTPDPTQQENSWC